MDQKELHELAERHRIEPWLADNYAEVREQRGWTWGEMADFSEASDHGSNLVALFRELDEAAPVAREAAVKRTAGKKETATNKPSATS